MAWFAKSMSWFACAPVIDPSDCNRFTTVMNQYDDLGLVAGFVVAVSIFTDRT